MAAELPSRRERRRLEVRDRILEAALGLFEAQGYEATTVTEIARRSDIAYGTFFNHFPTKLDLLRDISDRTLRGFFEDLEQIRKQPGTFSDHLVTLFEDMASRVAQAAEQTRELHAAMMALAFPESAVSDDRLMRLAFRRFLEDGLANGEVRDDVQIETLMEVVVGTWYSLFLRWVHFDDYPILERAQAAGRFLASTLTGYPSLQDAPTAASEGMRR